MASWVSADEALSNAGSSGNTEGFWINESNKSPFLKGLPCIRLLNLLSTFTGCIFTKYGILAKYAKYAFLHRMKLRIRVVPFLKKNHTVVKNQARNKPRFYRA